MGRNDAARPAPRARPTNSPDREPTVAGPACFSSASGFRDWLKAGHYTAAELWVGFNSKASGIGGLAYGDALDEALCFGWIDGVRRRIDPNTYAIRFTPRRSRSTWSRVNVRHARRLIAEGRMQDAGLRAFEARDEERTGVYSYERRPGSLPAPLEREFRANPGAWAFWSKQPPGYRRTAIWWVVSAARAQTRRRRLSALVATSAASKRLGLLI